MYCPTLVLEGVNSQDATGGGTISECNTVYDHHPMSFYDVLEIDWTAAIFNSSGINLILMTSTAKWSVRQCLQWAQLITAVKGMQGFDDRVTILVHLMECEFIRMAFACVTECKASRAVLNIFPTTVYGNWESIATPWIGLLMYPMKLHLLLKMLTTAHSSYCSHLH